MQAMLLAVARDILRAVFYYFGGVEGLQAFLVTFNTHAEILFG